jgi:signal transduction histidine kinase
MLINVSVTYSPIRDGKGNLVAVTSITRDISERKRTDELLRRSDKLSMVGQLAAGIAHEVRNPLTSIKGFIQLFQEKINPEYVQVMLSELDRIELIITEFLSLAKPHATYFKKKGLEGIIKSTLAIVETQAIMKGIEVKTTWADITPFIHCDENKLKQVLINILKNGMEAMPMGGKIYIQLHQEQQHVHIRIIDEGCGISEQRLQKLGEPFYSSKEKGTGLGLMICFKIIEEHNGRIEIESKEGKGTAVNIILPVV